MGRAAAAPSTTPNRHRRAPDDGARHGGAAGSAAAGALRLPVHDLGKGTTPAEMLAAPHRPRGAQRRSWLRALCERLRVPADCRELAEVVAREHGNIHRSAVARRRGHAAPARTLRRAAPAGALRAGAAGLRVRCARPRRARDAPYPQRARLPPRCARVPAVGATAAPARRRPAIGAAVRAGARCAASQATAAAPAAERRDRQPWTACADGER